MESIDISMKEEIDFSKDDVGLSIVASHTEPAIPGIPPAESRVCSSHETVEQCMLEETILKCKEKLDRDATKPCDHSGLCGAELFKQMEEPQKDCVSGRERLKRHREEVSGQVMIPDSWGQESLLRDWIDYSTFDKMLEPKGLSMAREALMADRRRPRIESRC